MARYVVIAEIGLILVAGNLASALSWLWGIPINTGPVGIGLALLIYVYLGWKGRTGTGWNRQLWKPDLKNSLLALGAGLLLSGPPLLFFLFPVLVGKIDYTPIKTLSLAELLLRVVVQVPLFTALSEELLFRQYLFEKLARPRLAPTLALNSLIFMLWHLVVVLRTVLDTSFSQSLGLTGLSYLGALASVFVGGVVFGLVRWRTGSFFYSARTHWLNVALLNILIWLL